MLNTTLSERHAVRFQTYVDGLVAVCGSATRLDLSRQVGAVRFLISLSVQASFMASLRSIAVATKALPLLERKVSLCL